MMKNSWVGVDVSKSYLDVSVGEEHKRFRTSTQLDEAAAWIDAREPIGVVVEATGGYERPLVRLLQQQHDVAVVNPRCVRDFAKSRGLLAKTDKLDARVLAQFGVANTPRITRRESAFGVELRAVVSRREQVVELRKLSKQHLATIENAAMLEQAKKLVKELDAHVRALEKVAMQLVRKDAAIEERVRRLQTAPGIGRVLAISLTVHIPELGTLTKGEVAALAGLAPMNCDSGEMRGQRHIRGGRPRVRQAAYIAAAVSLRCTKSPFRDLIQRLRQQGKPAKVALVAAARHILIALNAMLKTSTDFQHHRALAA